MNFDSGPLNRPAAEEESHDPFRVQLAYLTFVVATILLACAPALVIACWRGLL